MAPPGHGDTRLRRLALALALLPPIAAEAWLRLVKSDQWLTVGTAYLAACLLFAVLAPRSAARSEPAAAESPRWPLVAISVALLVAGVVLGWRDMGQWVLAPIWLGGVAVWLLAWNRRLGRPRLPRREWLLLGLVLAVAAALRLWNLDYQPVQTDEFVMAHIALRRAWSSLADPFGPKGLSQVFQMAANDGNSQLVLGTYRRLLLYWLAGIDMTTLRLPSALLGVLEVGLVFVLGRQLFNPRVGLVAASVLSTLAVHLTWSRHGDDNIEGSFVWTLTGLLLARAVVRRSVPLMATAGAALSLALYLYLSARPMIAVVLVFLLMAALDPAVRGRWLLRGSLALATGFLVGAGPLLVTLYRDPQIFTYNSGLTSWLGEALKAYQQTGDLASLLPLWEHFYRALMAYNLVPSADQHYWPGRGLFVLLPAALLYAAVALVSLRLLDWRNRLLAMWFWAPTLGLSALSDFPPPVHRLLPVLPGAALLIGLAVDRIVARWEGLGPAARRLAVPVAAVALGVALTQEAGFYFLDYARRDLDPWQNGLARAILAIPPGRYVGVMPGFQPVDLTLYFATNLERRNPYGQFGRAASGVVDGRPRPVGALYMLNGERTPWVSILREAFPSGQERQIVSTDPEVKPPLVWTAYEVGADEIERYRGLRLLAVDATGRRIEIAAQSVATPALPSDLTYPVDLEWRGWFHNRVADGQPSALVSTGSVAPRLVIGEAVVDLAGGGARPRLPPAAQPLYASARLSGPSDSVAVDWDGPTHKTREPFPANAATTYPGDPRLVVDWLSVDGRELLRREYDVMVADYTIGLRDPRPPPLLVRWSGDLDVQRPDTYEFQLVADGPIRLLIDGRQVWPTNATTPAQRPGGAPETTRARVALSAGRHPIVVERVRTEGGQAGLMWRRGSEPFTVVPASAYAPLAWP